MAWNNVLSPAWVDAGADIYWWYTFSNNSNALYAMANCLSPDAQLMTTEEGEQLNEDSTVTYFVNFHNNGPMPCFHNLNIGGLT